MKHFLDSSPGGYSATPPPALRPGRQDAQIDPVLAEVFFPLNSVDRLGLKIIECHNRPVLLFERQRLLPNQSDWRVVREFRIAFAHAQAIHSSLARLIEKAKE
jgi:hypothetical protein